MRQVLDLLIVCFVHDLTCIRTYNADVILVYTDYCLAVLFGHFSSFHIDVTRRILTDFISAYIYTELNRTS